MKCNINPYIWMYDFNLMFVTLSNYLTMHVYSWNQNFHLNYIIWCYWIRCVVLMMMSWVEIQDDWIRMWIKIGSVIWFCRYLGTSRYKGDSTEILVEILVEPVYLKKNNLLENFQCFTKKDVGNRGCYNENEKKVRIEWNSSCCTYFLTTWSTQNFHK